MLLYIGHQPHAQPRLLCIPACPIYAGMVLYAQRPPRGQAWHLYLPACPICTGMLPYIGHQPRGKPRLLCIPACPIHTGMGLHAQRPPCGKPRLLYVPAWSGMQPYVGRQPLAVRLGICAHTNVVYIYWHARIYRSSASRLASAPIYTIVTIYTHTHRPGHTSGCHTQHGRATVLPTRSCHMLVGKANP